MHDNLELYILGFFDIQLLRVVDVVLKSYSLNHHFLGGCYEKFFYSYGSDYDAAAVEAACDYMDGTYSSN
jgi:hypothetical protein